MDAIEMQHNADYVVERLQCGSKGIASRKTGLSEMEKTECIQTGHRTRLLPWWLPTIG